MGGVGLIGYWGDGLEHELESSWGCLNGWFFRIEEDDWWCFLSCLMGCV